MGGPGPLLPFGILAVCTFVGLFAVFGFLPRPTSAARSASGTWILLPFAFALAAIPGFDPGYLRNPFVVLVAPAIVALGVLATAFAVTVRTPAVLEPTVRSRTLAAFAGFAWALATASAFFEGINLRSMYRGQEYSLVLTIAGAQLLLAGVAFAGPTYGTATAPRGARSQGLLFLAPVLAYVAYHTLFYTPQVLAGDLTVWQISRYWEEPSLIPAILAGWTAVALFAYLIIKGRG